MERVAARIDTGSTTAVYVRSYESLPEPIRQDAERMGDPSEFRAVWWHGDIYLITDRFTSAKDVEEAIFHELYHKWVAGFLGGQMQADLNTIFSRMGGREAVLKLADKYKWREARSILNSYAARTDLTKTEQVSAVVNELLAEAGSRHHPMVQWKIKEFVGAVREWFRKHGFLELAKITESDLAYLLKQARTASTQHKQNNPYFQRSEDGSTITPHILWREDRPNPSGPQQGGPLFSRSMPTADSDSHGVQSSQRSLLGDPHPDEALSVQSALEGKTVQEAAHFLARSAPTESARLIASKVAVQLERLQSAGMGFELHIAHLNDAVPSPLIGTRGLTWLPAQATTTQVWLQGADVTGMVGTSYETALHELVHAATQAAIHIGLQPTMQDSPLAQSVADLYAVTNAIRGHFNQRLDEANGDREKLTPFERTLWPHRNNPLNPFNDAGEVVAWSFSNPAMQHYLESIPYQSKNLWYSFVQAIRKFLGLPEKAETALSEVLRVGEALMEAPAHKLMTWLRMHWMPTQINQYNGLVNSQRSGPSHDVQGKIDDLNESMERRQGVPEAFQWSSDADQDMLSAYRAAFGVSIVPIKVKNPDATGFLAMQYHGTIFVRTDETQHGFVRMAGHELLHHLRTKAPSLYDWFAAQAERYIRSGADTHYGKRLEAAGADLSHVDVREEILADFTGDALADPRFLQTLAEQNASKFRLFLHAVRQWLQSVADRLTHKGFGSSRYFDDVEKLRGHLTTVLNAFHEGGSDAVGRLDVPLFSRIIGDAGRDYTPEQRAAMARTGSTVTAKTIKETLASLWQDAGKRMAQGLADQFSPVRDISQQA